MNALCKVARALDVQPAEIAQCVLRSDAAAETLLGEVVAGCLIATEEGATIQ